MVRLIRWIPRFARHPCGAPSASKSAVPICRESVCPDHQIIQCGNALRNHFVESLKVWFGTLDEERPGDLVLVTE
jgi:hypothetical protein